MLKKSEDDDKIVIGKDYMENAVPDVSFDMVYVKGGTFMMGAAKDDEEALDWEKPLHPVTLSDYYIGKCEVTQGLWKVVMGTTIEQQRDKGYKDSPWGRLPGVGFYYPMYYVSWEEAQEFVKKLSELTGKHYVLPTEAQWEYAARGGAKSKGYKYSGGNRINDVAWYGNNSDSSSHPVGTKHPNELGIYDMTGNVAEWCNDWFDEEYYACSPTNDPMGPSPNIICVNRGGNWLSIAKDCRVSYRACTPPDCRFDDIGFRLALFP